MHKKALDTLAIIKTIRLIPRFFLCEHHLVLPPTRCGARMWGCVMFAQPIPTPHKCVCFGCKTFHIRRIMTILLIKAKVSDFLKKYSFSDAHLNTAFPQTSFWTDLSGCPHPPRPLAWSCLTFFLNAWPVAARPVQPSRQLVHGCVRPTEIGNLSCVGTLGVMGGGGCDAHAAISYA